MSDDFVKVYGKRLLSSSLLSECWQARLVFLSMLAASDRLGRVDVGGVPGLSRVINLSVEDTEIGLAVLESADSNSRDLGHDGCRVRRDGAGWLILNRVKYRDLRSEKQMQAAERQARRRERNSVTQRDVTRSHAESRAVTPRIKREKKPVTHSVMGFSSNVSEDDVNELYQEYDAAVENGEVINSDRCDSADEEAARWNRLNSGDPRLVDAFDVATGTRDPTRPPPLRRARWK